ncbi:unnamed protein product, partial [Pleuronectes platessa]
DCVWQPYGVNYDAPDTNWRSLLNKTTVYEHRGHPSHPAAIVPALFITSAAVKVYKPHHGGLSLHSGRLALGELVEPSDSAEELCQIALGWDGNLGHNAGGLSFEATSPSPISPSPSCPPLLPPVPLRAHQAERKASISHRQTPEPGCRQWKPSSVTTKTQI